MITVHVLFFGPLRDLRGRADEAVELAGPIPMSTLYAQLFPGPQRIPVASVRNGERVADDTLCAHGDELVFLPPVGGG